MADEGVPNLEERRSAKSPRTGPWGRQKTEEEYFNSKHEIKRRLLLRRKVMTNLDSILKSRDITLPTKVKAMVFPVVMY